MEDRIDCNPDPGSVRAARLFVVDRLQDWGLDELVDSASLLTSELATNAVLHTRRPFLVQARRQGSSVRIEVVDQSPEVPHLPRHLAGTGPRRAAASPAATGDVLADAGDDAVDRLFSGLGMVDAVATRWGADALPDDGKVVWFELQADAHHHGNGLSSLRHRDDEPPDPALADLPPLAVEGLDDSRATAVARVALVVVLVALLGAAVYAGLWAGGVLGEVWYGH